MRKCLTLSLAVVLALGAVLNLGGSNVFAASGPTQKTAGGAAGPTSSIDLSSLDRNAVWPSAGPASPKTNATQGSPEGDYGDAPDGSIAGYEEPYSQIIGRFPTLFNTTNSRVGRPGAHALSTGTIVLGERVSREFDSNSSSDPDGTSNLVDEDRYDDGLRIGFDPADPDTPNTIDIVVASPDTPRYVNVVADLNHDGVWQQFGDTEEWIVKNQLSTGASSQAIAAQIPFSLIEQASPIWIRVVVSTKQISEQDFASVGGWDGSGEFDTGEVEDHFLPVAKAIAAAFAVARASASACAFASFTVTALAQAVSVAQANVTAIAAALAQAQANVNAAAVAAANAQASAQAAAVAAAQASSTAQQSISISVSVPCASISASLTATAN
ncbi:MAG TPA: hypothetical protein VFV34_15280, partial [Blastocatellia bacterium]|nr:hypothetical protein [Blastocatellia bacterium]